MLLNHYQIVNNLHPNKTKIIVCFPKPWINNVVLSHMRLRKIQEKVNMCNLGLIKNVNHTCSWYVLSILPYHCVRGHWNVKTYFGTCNYSSEDTHSQRDYNTLRSHGSKCENFIPFTFVFIHPSVDDTKSKYLWKLECKTGVRLYTIFYMTLIIPNLYYFVHYVIFPTVDLIHMPPIARQYALLMDFN